MPRENNEYPTQNPQGLRLMDIVARLVVRTILLVRVEHLTIHKKALQNITALQALEPDLHLVRLQGHHHLDPILLVQGLPAVEACQDLQAVEVQGLQVVEAQDLVKYHKIKIL